MSVPANEQLLGKKKTCAKFQIDVSETDALVRVYTSRVTTKSTQLVCSSFIGILYRSLLLRNSTKNFLSQLTRLTYLVN